MLRLPERRASVPTDGWEVTPNHPLQLAPAAWSRSRGETPLHRAAAYASEETVLFLLEAGADKTIRDANGDSPQSWASWHWRPNCLIDLLDPAG